MSAIVMPEEEELYLLSIFDGADGIDLAEFCWVDEESPDGCFRAWDFQWPWYTTTDVLQIDQCGRSLGKSNGIAMRAFAFAFTWPGQDMLITAPELNHLRPLTDLIEGKILSTRLAKEMLPKTKGHGLSRQPHWQARFANGARIISRLPNRDGKGVKGMHPLVLEADEMQDYPEKGWMNLIECLKRGSEGAQWRCHGVSRGSRDKYWDYTQDGSEFTVHRYMAQHRPTWSDAERREKIENYGGSRQNPDYKRNIYGEHGDATNPVFVIARLMACVDGDDGSDYNSTIYANIRIENEQLMGGRSLSSFMDLPGQHLTGWSQMSSEMLEDGTRKPPREVGAVKGYNAYYAGMDVGMTNHPSEILVFGQRASSEQLDLLTRINLMRIDTSTQIAIIRRLFDFYGQKLKGFGVDKTGIGFSIWDILDKDPAISARVHGFNFSSVVPVGFEDRPLKGTETMEDLAIRRNFVEHSTDVLRRDYVDPKRMLLPFDRELLGEWQGQSYTEESTANPYGKKNFARGKFHTLDAAKCAMGAKTLPAIYDRLSFTAPVPAAPDIFVGASYGGAYSTFNGTF